MDERWLRVGEVARRTGLTVRTLHHYDDLGLLVPSGRSGGDYRLYSADDLRRLLAIQHLKSLGLSLEDVAAALDDPGFDAQEVVERHIAVVEARLAEEQELLARLKSLREASAAGWDEVLDVIALTERLRHPDPGVRVRAALDTSASAALETLVARLIAESDPGVRETLTWAVARHGRRATPLLIRLLVAADATVRLVAAHTLSKLGDREAVPALAIRLSDADAAVVRKAAFALGRLGGPEALDALVSVLGMGDQAQRDTVASALARFGAAASAALVTTLSTADAAARAHAADALALIGDPDTATPLTVALGDPDATTRFAALVALGHLRGEVVRDAIAGATRSDDARVRALASRLLADQEADVPRS